MFKILNGIEKPIIYINLVAGIDRQGTLKSFSYERGKFWYRMDDGIGVEKMKEEITRWENMFDSELSILRNWDYISTNIRIGIDEDKREYFDGLMKNKMNSVDLPD